MAFGDVLDFASATAASITDPFPVDSGDGLSVAVSAGDLVIAVLHQQTSLTVTAVTDNLGNTYTAQNDGTDGGTPTGRMFYSVVTVGGTLNTVNFDTTSSLNDVGAMVAVYAGPFTDIGANPGNATGSSDPAVGPATGVLPAANGLVVGWLCTFDEGGVSSVSGGGSLTATIGSGRNVSIASHVTSATTSVTYTWELGNVADFVAGIASFTQAASGQPYYYREGGIPFCANSNNGIGHTVWRKSLGWRKTLSGLLAPPRPRILRPAFH